MNIQDIKKDFAIFSKHPNLIYLDSTATSLTPQRVVEKLCEYYTTYNANIARGVYAIGTRATAEYENSRKIIAQFIHAQDSEIIFTSGTTMSLNMVAFGLRHLITSETNIVTTIMEHHANFIPWQQLCLDSHAQFRITTLTENHEIDQIALLNAIDNKTRIVALSHVSNVLGIINPLKDIIQKIRKKNPGVIIVVDAAQSICHIPIDVINLDCDFLAFSMHKIFGPTGVGILYGKSEQLEKLTPLFTGGEMISEVTSQCTHFRELPHRLEAGTPHISGVIASQEAINYIQKIGFSEIIQHEQEILKYAITSLQNNFGSSLHVYGPTDHKNRCGLISFTFQNYHPHDIATILDQEKSIAVRAGQHCAMPLHREFLHTPATVRASFSVYTSINDIDQLIDGLKKVDAILSTRK